VHTLPSLCANRAHAVPSPPVNLSIFNITPTMFLIQWDPPTHPNGIILRYEVFYTGEDTLNDVPESFYNTTVVGLSPNTTSLELVELEPYSVYNITIRAVNGAGNGAFSSEMGLLTQTEPFCEYPLGGSCLLINCPGIISSFSSLFIHSG